MSARQLLELAAKAAAIKGEYAEGCTESSGGNTEGILTDFGTGCYPYCWNPMTSDGDALRLAAKLGIDVRFCHASGIVTAVNPWTGREYCEPRGGHCFAILRAAASIGEAMP